MKIFHNVLKLLALAPLLACSAGGDPVPVSTGLLYVSDRGNQAVYIYDQVATIDGAVDPVRTISGDNTLLENPTAIAVDGRRDVLYVADSSSQQVLAFPQSSIANGDLAPLRLYPGLLRGSSLYVDISNNRLYAADALDQSIKAWDGVSGLSSGTAPNRTIPLGYEPSAVFVDTQRNLLYVGDPAGGAINIYKNASSLGVAATADSVIQDASNPFLDIRGITINTANDVMFVSDDNVPSVDIFEQASTLDGSIVPDRSLQGDTTGLTFDLGPALFIENVLYLQNSRTQVAIYDDANALDGNTAPTRQLTINPSNLITGIAVDLAH